MSIFETLYACVYQLGPWFKRPSDEKASIMRHIYLLLCIMQSLHQTQLRPSLGHPHNRTEMDTLCSSEERRRQEALDGAKQHAEALAVGHCNPFIQIGSTRGV